MGARGRKIEGRASASPAHPALAIHHKIYAMPASVGALSTSARPRRPESRSGAATRVRRALAAGDPDLAAWQGRQRVVLVELKFELDWRRFYAPRLRAILGA